MQREVMLNARSFSGHTIEQVIECEGSVNEREFFEGLTFWENVGENAANNAFFPQKTGSSLTITTYL